VEPNPQAFPPEPEKSNGLSKDADFTASVYPRDPLSDNTLGLLVRMLELELGMPVWCLLQGAPSESDPLTWLSTYLWDGLEALRQDLRGLKKAALLLDTNGGYPSVAYKISRLCCAELDEFVVLVPRRAKSAGTLLGK